MISGAGIVSCLGNSLDAVAENLKTGTSGIREEPTQIAMGFRSGVAAWPDIDARELIDKRSLRFMGDGAAWSAIAMQQAIDDAGLSDAEISHPQTGLIAGSGGPSGISVVRSADAAREKAPKRVGPFAVPKCMSSTVSACLATHFKIKGISYSITSACTTSLHCIGNAAEQIQMGKQDIIFAGGGEELEWPLSVLFDAMGAMSQKYNATPERASRAFDSDRDGFVIAGGAGMLVLEEYERAKARGAKIYAEITGYGATSDGFDMVAPSGEGAVRSMQMALRTARNAPDYINPHATSTPVGDVRESEAIYEVFGDDGPWVSATKSLTGHSLGAAGVQEAIYSLLMMRDGFIAPSINIDNLDPELAPMKIARQTESYKPKSIMSNSFGFGGTNGSLLMEKL